VHTGSRHPPAASRQGHLARGDSVQVVCLRIEARTAEARPPARDAWHVRRTSAAEHDEIKAGLSRPLRRR